MTITIVAAVVAVIYALYKHVTVAEIKAELAKIESEAVNDAKTVIYRIKAKL